MRALLEAMKIRIADQVLYLGGDKAVHLLVDENAIPASTSFPCVGLKDGPVINEYKVGMSPPVKHLDVDIIGFVLINDPESVIIGKGNEKGILDLMEDLRAALEHWAPTDYTFMNGTINETPSSYMTNEETLVQKKKMTITWRRRG
jgi:hypothetical protein